MTIRKPIYLWKNLLTSFIYRFEELVTNYNDVADTSEIIKDDEKKDMLRRSILGHPDLLNVEISDKSHQRVHGHKMTYDQYHEHVLEICQSVEISRQENKISSDRISEIHEQESLRETNVHDTKDNESNTDNKDTDKDGQDDNDDNNKIQRYF